MAPIWQRYFEDCDCVSVRNSASLYPLCILCFFVSVAQAGLFLCPDSSCRFCSLLMPVIHRSLRMCTISHPSTLSLTANWWFLFAAWSIWRESPPTLLLMACHAPNLNLSSIPSIVFTLVAPSSLQANPSSSPSRKPTDPAPSPAMISPIFSGAYNAFARALNSHVPASCHLVACMFPVRLCTCVYGPPCALFLPQNSVVNFSLSHTTSAWTISSVSWLLPWILPKFHASH